MNLRKITGLVFIGMLVFSFSYFVYSLFEKNNEEKTKDDLSFVGYIPTKNKPIWVWKKGENGKYQKTGEIDVVFDTGEKFKAKFAGDESWPGAVLVIHKDSYPPVKGKIIKIFGHYRDDDNFWLEKAEL